MTVKNILSKNWLPLPYGDPKMGSRHLLRRSFILREDQKGGAVSVTAGSVYRLYVNGKTVMAGPARGTSGYFFYDTVEIGGYLRPGPNVIALETAYFPNNVPETIQYEFPLHEPGISVCLELSGISEAPLPLTGDWKILSLDCFDPGAVWSRGLVSEFVFAKGLPAPRWIHPGFDDSEWRSLDTPAITQAPAELRERSTPLPLVRARKPEKLTDAGFFYYMGKEIEKQDREELFWFGVRDRESSPSRIGELDRVQFRKICKSVSGGPWAANGSSLLGGSAGKAVLSGNSERSGFFTWDFGRIVSGTAYIEATVPAGCRIDVSLMEWLNSETGSPGESRDRVCGVMIGAGGFTIIGDGRRIRFESIQQHNARYMCVVLRTEEGEQEAVIHDAGITEICALRENQCAAGAVCSDPLLNRILEAAKQTIRVNAHDYYVDCTCERIVTSGDCLQASRAGRLFYGDAGRAVSETMFHLFIDQGFIQVPDWSRTPRGRCCAVTRKDTRDVWMLATAMLILDILSWSREQGRGELPDKFTSFFSGIAKDIEQHLTGEGLIESTGTTGNWNDWSKMAVGNPAEEYTGVSVSTNAFFYRAFRQLQAALPEKGIYKQIADSIGSGIRELADPWIWSAGPRVSRFVPDLFLRSEGRLEPFTVREANVFGGSSQLVSETAQYWLLWSRVLDEKQEERLWDVLRGWQPFRIPVRDNTRMINPSRASSIMGLYPRFSYLRGRFDPVIYQNLREAFGPAAASGDTLWEGLEQDSRSGAHGTSAYAGTLLYESLTGIQSCLAGETVTIAPIIHDSLEWARGYRDTPAGTVGVSWRRGENTFSIAVGLPPGLGARIKLPPPVIGELAANGHAVPEAGIVEAAGCVEITASRDGGLRVRALSDTGNP